MHHEKRSTLARIILALAAVALLGGLPLLADTTKDNLTAKPSDVTVTGEVLDMACYLDHGASGAKHAACAEKCIKSGLPVGLKASDGKTYLLVGEHMPANDELAPYGGKTITVKGKLAERDGISVLENIEIVKS